MERRRRDLAIDVVLGDDDADEQEIRRGTIEIVQNEIHSFNVHLLTDI